MKIFDAHPTPFSGRLLLGGLVAWAVLALGAGIQWGRESAGMHDAQPGMHRESRPSLITLFLAGDVMTGRGIDQVLPHPGDLRLHERYAERAQAYVALMERAHGPIRKPVSFSYIWGDALREWERVAPDVRIVNLETSITESDRYWEGKGVHYRMHPENMPCLTAAGIDCCVLANNHVLDWGYAGLSETLEALQEAHIKSAGAGHHLRAAGAPAVLDVPAKGRVIVFAYGSRTSGIPHDWAASKDRPGVNLLDEYSGHAIRRIKAKVGAVKRPGDIVVVSIHWGGNWGYRIPSRQRTFAHRLIDEAGVDLIHGHSSHHVKGLEVYKGRLIIYGAGDFLTDYEGIEGYEAYRDDLDLMYFASVDPSTGTLARLRMTPMQIKRFRLNRASPADALWVRDVLNREGARLGTRVEINQDHTLTLRWK